MVSLIAISSQGRLEVEASLQSLALIGLWQGASGPPASGSDFTEACTDLLGMGPVPLSSMAGGSVKFCQ